MALRNGARFSVGMADVFPDGCYLVPGSISEAQDYDEKTKTRRPAKDKVTGTRVFQCRVVDARPGRRRPGGHPPARPEAHREPAHRQRGGEPQGTHGPDGTRQRACRADLPALIP
jgi:hypothetical protein